MSKMVWFAAFFILPVSSPVFAALDIQQSTEDLICRTEAALVSDINLQRVAALITAVSVAAKAAKWFAATELSVRHANAIKALEAKIMIGILAGMGPKLTAPFVDKVVHLCQQIYDAKNDIDFPQ